MSKIVLFSSEPTVFAFQFMREARPHALAVLPLLRSESGQLPWLSVFELGRLLWKAWVEVPGSWSGFYNWAGQCHPAPRKLNVEVDPEPGYDELWTIIDTSDSWELRLSVDLYQGIRSLEIRGDEQRIFDARCALDAAGKHGHWSAYRVNALLRSYDYAHYYGATATEVLEKLHKCPW